MPNGAATTGVRAWRSCPPRHNVPVTWTYSHNCIVALDLLDGLKTVRLPRSRERRACSPGVLSCASPSPIAAWKEAGVSQTQVPALPCLGMARLMKSAREPWALGPGRGDGFLPDTTHHGLLSLEGWLLRPGPTSWCH